MKIIYNKLSKSFSIRILGLDENNWEQSYINLLKQADEQCRLISKAYSSNSELQFRISYIAEIQYTIFYGFTNKLKWTYNYLPNTGKYLEFSKACRNTLRQLEIDLKKLIENPDCKSEPYDGRDKKLKGGRYFKLDNFNRFAYKLDLPYNVNILSIMFHHNDKIEDKGSYELWMKELLKNVFDSILNDQNFKENRLSDLVTKLRKS